MDGLRKVLHQLGYRMERLDHYPGMVDDTFRALHQKYRDYTMLNWIKLYNTYNAVRYAAHNRLPGAIVECGVYRGGCVGMMLETLVLHNDTARDVYVYDTFDGMPQPGPEDINVNKGFTAQSAYDDKTSDGRKWLCVPLEDVRAVAKMSGYPMDKVHFVKGRVEETIPGIMPDTISVLRLDTDWYASTKHEMEHLYPKLIKGGVLIVDDYGTWSGSGKAVDEYLKARNIPFYFTFDESGSAATGVKID